MRRILPLLFCIVVSTSLYARRDCSLKEYEQKALTGFIRLSANKRVNNDPKQPAGPGNLSGINGTVSTSTVKDKVITIPIVVHVLYNTAAQNISDAQIRSQINVLNKDYSGSNADIIKVPDYFAPYAADGGFEFQLAKIDPQGYATNGIVRRQTNIQLFGTDDRMKFSSKGGDDAWDRNRYLNIWICNMAGGIVGYASATSGLPENDGVVIHSTAFGTTGNIASPFALGRTATHEIGHWLNLLHIWGDQYCGDDGVDDTPKQRSSNRGCPGGKKYTCGTTDHGDMYMNFMDLTDDACMFMFTKGQVKRMRALFDVGGIRYKLLSSNALTGTPLQPPLELKVEQGVSPIEAVVYPNPAGSVITLELNGFENENKNIIVVYSSIGQPVITQIMTGNRITINISHLRAGIYFIKWAYGVTKFVKE